MKKIIFFALIFFLAGAFVFISCKKEYSCEGSFNCNKPPIAVAGPDQVITLPTDSISLDGSASNDPDGTISEWLWARISGPASLNINNGLLKKTLHRFYRVER
jgi:hypothetical protein